MPEREPERESVSEPVKQLCMFCESTDPAGSTDPATPSATAANVPGALSSAPSTATHVPHGVPEPVSEPERTGEPVSEPQRDAQRLPEPFGEHFSGLLIFMW